MKTKLCKKCGIEKPLSEMVKNTRLRDGVTSACGKCHSKQYYTSKDPKEKNCLKCRGIFIGTGRQKYCSDHCCDSHYRFLNREKKADYNRRYRHSYERKKHLTKNCVGCEDAFSTSHKHQKYCSHKCATGTLWKLGLMSGNHKSTSTSFKKGSIPWNVGKRYRFDGAVLQLDAKSKRCGCCGEVFENNNKMFSEDRNKRFSSWCRSCASTISTLRLKKRQIPKDLLLLKRTHLKLKRSIKQIQL